MSNLYTDTFDHYDTAHIDYKWAIDNSGSGNTITVVSGISGMTNNCLKIATVSNGYYAAVIQNLVNNISGNLFVGFNFQCSNLPSSSTAVFAALGADGVPQLLFAMSATGAIKIYYAPAGAWYASWPSNATLIGSSSNGLISANATNYIEFQAFPSDTVGIVNVWVNNAQVLTLTNVNTAPFELLYNQLWLINQVGAGSPNNFYDDLYLNDTSVTSADPYQTGRFGPVQGYYIAPNAAGQSTQCTPTGAGSNYQCVGFSTPEPDDDTTYNECSTVGLTDLFATNYELSPQAVCGMQWVACIRNAGSGSITMKPKWGNGSSSIGGSLITGIGSSYIFQRQTSGINPLTNSPWAPADLSTLQPGYTRTV